MAPPHSETGAMVYLANLESRPVMRGLVSCQTSTAASKHTLETAFLFGSDTCLPVTSHLKSFPSEKTKRGHYV